MRLLVGSLCVWRCGDNGWCLCECTGAVRLTTGRPCVQVQSLIAAAKESLMCALRLQQEVDFTKQVTKQDVELHERLMNQVSGGTASTQLLTCSRFWYLRYLLRLSWKRPGYCYKIGQIISFTSRCLGRVFLRKLVTSLDIYRYYAVVPSR